MITSQAVCYLILYNYSHTKTDATGT